MTCFERLKELRPALFGEGIEYVATCFCPGEFGMREPVCYGPFDESDCIKCWDLEACMEDLDD